MARRRGAQNDNYSRLPRPVAEAGKALVIAARRATPQPRLLPDFLVIGAQRCGTTSLYRYLAAHPRVLPAVPSKGVHYFDRPAGASLGWYRAHFPTAAARRRAARREGGPVLTGEASPYYLFHPHAAPRVARALPDVRCVAMLRDPVERAHSQYQQEYARGFEDAETFEEALDREPERLAGERERMLRDESYASFSHQHHSYVARGEYAAQLEEWLAHVPRERLLVVVAEHFFADPRAVLERVLGFLDLPPGEPPAYRAHNARSYAPMNQETRERLARHFEPHNARLAALLGEQLPWTRPQAAVTEARS